MGLMIITQFVGERLAHCYLALSWNGSSKQRNHFLDEYPFMLTNFNDFPPGLCGQEV
jgi:hypothetical protein